MVLIHVDISCTVLDWRNLLVVIYHVLSRRVCENTEPSPVPFRSFASITHTVLMSILISSIAPLSLSLSLTLSHFNPPTSNSREDLQALLTNSLRQQARAVLSASVLGEWTSNLVGVTRMWERCGPSRSDQKSVAMSECPVYPPVHLKDESRLSKFVSHVS
jgi:hypothetical protein